LFVRPERLNLVASSHVSDFGYGQLFPNIGQLFQI
jgi:hypothetical protein